MATRTIQLSEGQDRIVGKVLASGHYRDAGEVVDDALRLLERRQTREAAKMKRLLALVAEAEAEYARGEYIEVADDQLADWLAGLGKTGRRSSAS